MVEVVVSGIAQIAAGQPKLSIMSRHDNIERIFVLQDDNFTVAADINLSPVDNLRIKFSDKIHVDGAETWCEIKHIMVDGINLQHFILRGKQYPNYDSNFYNEYNPPDYYQPGTKFYHNGILEYDIKLPIWKHLMDQYYV